MKKFAVLFVMCVLFMTMGVTVQAKSHGEKEQSVNVFSLLGEDISEQGSALMEWIKENASKEETADIVREVTDFIREKWQAGKLENEEDISEAIAEGEEKFDVTLTEEEKEEIRQVIQKIKELGLDPEKLLDRAEGLCEDAGTDVLGKVQETAKESFAESVSNFFQDMTTRVKGFFTNIFS